MSGGLILSIKDLRRARFRDGPGKKNLLPATPCQQRRETLCYQSHSDFPVELYAYVSIRCERTTSSPSAFSPSLPFFSAETGSSFDVLIARFASSPMRTASSAYGPISSTRVFGESSEPNNARCGCACCRCCFRSESDSSESPAWPSWKDILARPECMGGERTEDWSRSRTVFRW
jgi:hypothetical protein